MATVEELWVDRPDMTKGARRLAWEAGRYVSLALSQPADLEVSPEDLLATDWVVCGVSNGQAVDDG